MIDAIAVHGHGAIGGMLPNVDLTSISLGKPYLEGGRFIATHSGHLQDGTVVTIHGVDYRLNVVGARREAA